MNLGAYISIGSAVTAFVSATLWVIAARARVSYDPKPNEDGFYPSGISDGDDDFIETVKKQVEWNRWAAIQLRLPLLCRAFRCYSKSLNRHDKERKKLKWLMQLWLGVQFLV
jgi:hypothetical protein